MNLRKKAETSSTITLEWDPVPGAVGYRFQSASSQPKWSHTFDPARTEVKFAKAAWYTVEALDVADSGKYPSAARFVADFEDGTYDVFKDEDGFAGWNLDKRPVVVGADGPISPRQGSKMARLELRQGEHPPWSTGTDAIGFKRQPQAEDGLGCEVCLGWSICLRSPFPFLRPPGWQIFMEWHGDNSFQAAFQQTISFPNGVPTWRFNSNYLGTGNWHGHDLMAVEEDEWIDSVVRFKWSKGADGIFEGWSCKRGQDLAANKRFSRPGQNWYASGQNSVAVQPVYYRAAHTQPGIAYYDIPKVGATFEDVAPVN